MECCYVGLKLWFQRIINAKQDESAPCTHQGSKTETIFTKVIYHFYVGTCISLSIKMGKTLADK